MIKNIKNKLKNEKGAISAFALMSMVFFLIFIVSVFVFFTRRSQTQAETLRLLAEKYNGKTEDDIVSTLVSNEADIIPIYTLEQLYEIGSNKYITVPQENGKIYKHLYKEDLNTADEYDDRAMYKLMQNWGLDELTDVLLKVIENHPENQSGFVDLDTNQAKGMYIVNFPNIAKGKIVVNKTIKKSDAAGFYYGPDSEIIYQIEIINDGEVDVDNIEVADTIRKMVEGETTTTSEILKVYVDEACTIEYTPGFSLKTRIQDDGTVRDHAQHDASRACDICEFLYVKYITTAEDVRNKHILENYVEVKGDSSGVTARGSDTSPQIAFAARPEYHKENLVIWYDGHDNTAEGESSTERHDSKARKWFDKSTPQTNADIGNSNNWENEKYYKIEETGDTITFSETDELENMIGELNKNTSHDFTIQIVFEPQETDGVLYAFGRRDAASRCARIYNSSFGGLSLGCDATRSAALTGLNRIQRNGKYILTITGNFRFEDEKLEGKKNNRKYVYYYELEYKAYLHEVSGDMTRVSQTDGTISEIASITRDEYEYNTEYYDSDVIFGFDYNILGNMWNDYGEITRWNNLYSKIYSYRLYNTRLNANEVERNVEADVYRFFL